MNRSQRFVCGFAVLFILSCFFPSHPSSAGDDWLPVPPEDLALKDNPASRGANAMILYRESDMDSKESSVREYVRIKVFTQEGTKEGDVQIAFIKSLNNIVDVRGRTIHPDGSIVNFDGKVYEKELVKFNGFKYLAKAFTLPDVHPGSIIEYKYRDQSDPTRYVNETWTVTSHLFTRDARFSIKPDTSAYILPIMYRPTLLPASAIPVRQANGSYSMDIHNLPGLEQEPFMPPDRELESRVEFFYRKADEPATETTDQYWERIGKIWSDITDHFVNKKSALQADLARTVDSNDPPELKLRKIYARVQKIRNLSMEDSKSEKEIKQEQIKSNSNVEDLFKRDYGNGFQINSALVGLARAAGFEADTVYVAPRNSNNFSPNLQDLRELGAEIVWVRAGSKEYFLDPASSFHPFDVLPWYETYTVGLRAGKKPNDFITVPLPPSTDATLLRHADLVMDADGGATGKITVDLTGQIAALRRQDYRHSDDTGRKKILQDEIQGWLPSNSNLEITKIDNWEKIDLPIHVEGSVKLAGLGSPAGRRLLVPATIFSTPQIQAFKSVIRHNDIHFAYPFEEIDDLTIQAPPSYKVETVPAPKIVKPGSVVTYEISASQQQNSISVKRHLVVRGTAFPVDSYAALRLFFNTVKSNDDSQAVFQTAESASNN